MCVTTLLAIIVPLFMEGSMRTNEATGEVTFDVPSPMLGYAMIGLRFLCMLGFYGGVVGVIYSIFVFEAPAGPDATLPVSPTVQCVVNLASQFFFVYLVLIVCLTVSEVSGGRVALEKYRMYALLITDKKGAPQAWVQDGMYMATWSLLISF